MQGCEHREAIPGLGVNERLTYSEAANGDAACRWAYYQKERHVNDMDTRLCWSDVIRI